ncbi:DoxX family protein [Natronosalvus rutilus]|uniref:DoxX family protein n=1 Tax=Natronosalvus rutilus TaxID=2953753 RepID=A0A9E7ND58_9EURY|nr:DoxX family protein [Natronosalvus rutilus]UTF54769.1 DoxX family protein [Natronosalvus rutilus]
MSTIETVIPVVQGLLGLAMVGAGSAKILGIDLAKNDFERYGYPQWFFVVTGGIEVVGGLGLLIGLVFAPILAVLGGMLIAATMLGAILTHLFRVDDPLWRSVPPAIYLIAGLFVTGFLLLSF